MADSQSIPPTKARLAKVEKLLRDPATKNLSDREIGRRCGASHWLVGRERERLKICALDEIYFMQIGRNGPIKIGYSNHVVGRLKQAQTLSPWKIRLLGTLPGDRQTEGELHQRFSRFHMRGEWFRPMPELLDFISKNAAPYVRKTVERDTVRVYRTKHGTWSTINTKNIADCSGNGKRKRRKDSPG